MIMITLAATLVQRRDTDGSWKYSVTAEPKYTREKENTPGNSTVTRRVLKVWKDNKENRPKEITVQLIGDGKVVDTVKLSEGNSWRL